MAYSYNFYYLHPLSAVRDKDKDIDRKISKATTHAKVTHVPTTIKSQFMK